MSYQKLATRLDSTRSTHLPVRQTWRPVCTNALDLAGRYRRLTFFFSRLVGDSRISLGLAKFRSCQSLGKLIPRGSIFFLFGIHDSSKYYIFTMKSLFPSSAGSISFVVNSGGQNFDRMVYPGNFRDAEVTAKHLACSVDLTELEFVAKETGGGRNETANETAFEVLVFPTPISCAREESDCDLAIAGVGMTHRDQNGDDYWDLCYEGKVYVGGWYQGYHTTISIPTIGSMESHVKHGLVAPFERGGRVYRTILANCNPESRTVHVSGKIGFQCGKDPTKGPLSGDGYYYVPIPYTFVSMLVFLICTLCTIRIRCNSHQRIYQEAVYIG